MPTVKTPTQPSVKVRMEQAKRNIEMIPYDNGLLPGMEYFLLCAVEIRGCVSCERGRLPEEPVRGA